MSQAGSLNDTFTPSIPTSFTTDAGIAVPVLNNLNVLGGVDITTSAAGDTVLITYTGAGAISWGLTAIDVILSPGIGYFCIAPGGALLLTLPPVSAFGDEIRVYLDGAFSYTIKQGAGQQIRYAQIQTTVGVGGSLTSTAQGDCLHMVCITPDLRWLILSGCGNPIII